MKPRKIPASHGKNITGVYASSKGPEGGIGYESALERDCIARFEINPAVTKIESQSVRIHYFDHLGKRRIYTPDLLVHYINRSPKLLEVKPRNILKKILPEYLERYAAAVKYARRRGWRFCIVTERYIRRGNIGITSDSSVSLDNTNLKGGIVKVEVGEHIEHNNQKYIITKILNIEKILARNPVSNTSQVLRIADIKPLSNNITAQTNWDIALENIPQERWEEAERKYQEIKPLLDHPSRTTDMVDAVAKANHVSRVTIYSWIRAYEETGKILSLLPKKRKDKGLGRLSEEAETIIDDILETEYLHQQRRSIKTVMRFVRERLLSAGLPVPHEITIRKRAKKIAPQKVVKKRYNPEMARRLSMSPGSFPGVNKALDVVQMDHSMLDIILVDSETRRPLGRPWLTLAIDIYSRAVVGYHISLDTPGTASAGACVANAILPKEDYLSRHPKVKGAWNCWGAMKKLHMDNAGEFRGKTLRQACINRGIHLEWRPVRRPEYGGHIERLMGTVMNEIHELPGSTFSSPQARASAKSEKTATLTLSELEQWFAIYIVDIYHQRLHSETKQAPAAMFERSLLDSGKLPDREADERRLRIDFLPIVMRKVQRRGIAIEGIYYYHPILEKYFASRNNQKLYLRRDPHDLSHIFLYDKDSQKYISIRYADITRPAINLWELRAARRLLKQNSNALINEDEIFKAYDRMRAVEDSSKKETKRVRRERERKITGRVKYKDLIPSHSKEIKNKVDTGDDPPTTEILPFDDVEKLI